MILRGNGQRRDKATYNEIFKTLESALHPFTGEPLFWKRSPHSFSDHLYSGPPFNIRKRVRIIGVPFLVSLLDLHHPRDIFSKGREGLNPQNPIEAHKIFIKSLHIAKPFGFETHAAGFLKYGKGFL